MSSDEVVNANIELPGEVIGVLGYDRALRSWTAGVVAGPSLGFTIKRFGQ